MITVDLPIDIYETAGDLAAKFYSRGSKGWLNMRDEIAVGMFTERNRNKWLPVASAPKDGSRFLGAEYDDGWVIGPCIWCKTSHVPLYGFHFTEGDPEDLNIAHPTHWMPLPAPPSITKENHS